MQPAKDYTFFFYMIYLAMLYRLFRVMKKYLICFQKNPILSASTKITDFTRCVMYDLNIANDVMRSQVL